VAVAVMPWLIPSLIVCALAGGAMATAGITTNTLLQRQSPDHLRGRVMGFYSFVALGMAPFGSLQAGWVAEHFGVRTAFALGGLVCAVAAGSVAWRFAPRVRPAAAPPLLAPPAPPPGGPVPTGEYAVGEPPPAAGETAVRLSEPPATP